MFALTQSQFFEKPVRFEGVSVSGNIDIFAYSKMVMDVASILVAQPLVANKPSVCHKVCNGTFSGYPSEAIDQDDAFLSGGVVVLVHHCLDGMEYYTAVEDSESEDVDIRIAILSVGPVHRKFVWTLFWHEFNHRLGNDVHIQDCQCHKTPDATHTGIFRRPIVKGRGERREVPRLDFAHGANQLGQTFDAGKIHKRTEMG